MNPAKYTLLTVVSMVILCCAISGYAETLQEMELIDQGEAAVVVRNPEEAVLIVESVIPQLSFESNMGIIKVEQSRPGEWILHLHPGTNLITFKSEGYKTISDVRLVVPKKRVRKVEVKVLKTLGTLIVESDPPGATIFLDGEDTGKQTSYEFEGQETGMVRLALKMTHYLTDTTEVEVKAGEITRIVRPLHAVGYLTFHTSPTEAEVMIDSGTEDALTLRTPVELLTLKVGGHDLSVYKPGYLSPQLSITIEKGRIVQKELELKRVEDLQRVEDLRRPESPVSVPARLVPSRPFYKKRWFWGVVATGIGSGAYYWWSQQQDGKPKPTGTIEVDVPWPK